MLSYHACQSYVVSVTNIVLYIDHLFAPVVLCTTGNRIPAHLSLHMFAYGVGTASGIYFSSLFAFGKSTNLLQLHVDIQILGGLVVSWNTLPGVAPLQ